MNRNAEIHRKTKETDILVKANLDGSGKSTIKTGIGFFDHILNQLSKHSLVDIEITAEGDLEIDQHHTVEDVGIALGQAFAQALGKKEKIRRYGSAVVPMDEALLLSSIDISGRGMLFYSVDVPVETVGSMPSDLIEEFLISFARNAGMTVHIKQLAGTNPHHIFEAVFKSLARSLREAVSIDEHIKGVPSTKGVI